VPWQWISELRAEVEIPHTGPLDGPLEVSFVDIDGDSQEELVVIWSFGQGMCNCEMRATVARRTPSGFRIISTLYGSLDVVHLPGGLRGVLNYSSDSNSIFELLVLRPGAWRLTSIFEGDYEYGSSPSTTCTSDDGSVYDSVVQGRPVFVDRDGVRVLEEIREDDGCGEESPPRGIRRVEDLLRRAGFSPTE
jgi:hypothetical protein